MSNRRQRGLSLATALFVITVMALLAVMILQLVRSNAETTQEELQLVRALYAAETGVEFGLNRVFPPNTPPASACPTAPFDLTKDGLNACSATVQCSSVTVDGTTYYTITSTGTCGPVSRTVQVRAK